MTTLAEILDAMERNGYTKVQDEYIEYDYSNTTHDAIYHDFTKGVVGACAIGQAGLNLGVNPRILDSRVCKVLSLHSIKIYDIWADIPRVNDTTNFKVSTIAKRTRNKFIKAGFDLNLEIDLTEKKL